ncbi:MAG: methyltransferase [Cellvibrionaceae bacterium]
MSDSCHALLLQYLNESANQETSHQETLWIVDENLPRDFTGNLAARSSLHAWTNRFDTWQTLRTASIDAELDDFQFADAERSFDRVVYRVSKERALVHHCINSAFNVLKSGGEMILIGEKNDGIKTHARKAEQVFGGSNPAKKHGLCYIGMLNKTDHSLGKLLPSDDYPQLRKITVGDFSFYSKPGIFGWNKIDRGSELLVEALQDNVGKFNTQGSLLDLGCGWGYLILTTAALSFSQRVATDNNVTALLAAQRNFEYAGLEVTALTDDCGSQLQTKFDLILCNPPFHRGFSVSGDLSSRFLQQTRRLLAPGGKALFVVNQFIPLDKLAKDLFEQTTLLSHRESFKVFLLGRK